MINESMEHIELIGGKQRLEKVNIRRGLSQRDRLSPLLFVLAMVLFIIIRQIVKIICDVGKRNGRINHLLYMDDVNGYVNNEKQLDIRVNNVSIFSNEAGMELG